MTTLDPKLSGEQHYLNQFKNRKTNQSKPRDRPRIGCKSGNSLRFRPDACEQRVNTDIEQKHIVDYKALDVIYQYRKNNLPSSCNLDMMTNQSENAMIVHQPVNTQQHFSHFITTPEIKAPKPYRMVHLNEIQNNLYLADANIFDLSVPFEPSTIIINLSSACRHQKYIRNAYTYTFNYLDTRNLSSAQFRKIIAQTNTILYNYSDIHPENNGSTKYRYQIIVVCDRGVNRSVSVVMAYAIMCKGLTYNYVNQYVDQKKLDVDTCWNHLTNHRITNLLKSLTPNSSNAI